MYPLEERSMPMTIKILKEIVWTHGKPIKISTNNGEEFKSQKFQAVLKHYDIQHNRMSSGHLKTNGKVKWLNHKVVQWLQQISAEKGN